MTAHALAAIGFAQVEFLDLNVFEKEFSRDVRNLESAVSPSPPIALLCQ